MERNIKLAYCLAFLKNMWFWLGIWVFYYLKFTNYAGIGLIEMSLVVAMTISEIPTGAVADLLGKKKTLFLSFFLQGFGAFVFVLASHLYWLITAVFIMGVGGSFYSGTLEALVFDSLKEKGHEKKYPHIIAHITSLSLIAPAICSVIGGFLYLIEPRLPYLGHAVAYAVGTVLTLLLIEPKIDTEKFSFKNFLVQTKAGFGLLFKEKELRRQIIILLSVGFVIVICDEMLNSFLGVEYGYKPEILGIVWAGIYLLSALASQVTPHLKKTMSFATSALIIGFLIAFSLLVSPWLGMILGGFSLLLRSCLQAIFGNVTSIIINENTPSEYRATTISTYNLIKNIPYVLTAYLLGSLADSSSALTLATILGFSLMLLLAYPLLTRIKSQIFR